MARQIIFLPVAPLADGKGIKVLAAFTNMESAQLAADMERGGIVSKIALFDTYSDFVEAQEEFDAERDAALAKLTEEEKAILGL